MKPLKIVVSTLVVTVILLAGVNSLAFASSSQGNGQGAGYGGMGMGGNTAACTGTCTAIPTASTVALTQSEKDALLYMVEEEKMARDVYQLMATRWNLPLFANIARSEQMHLDAVLTLINRYDLTSPLSSEAGVFNNSDLQALYTSLVQKGSQSQADALLVGGMIEEQDIADLQTRLKEVSHTDILQVFTNLMQGSYNHLQAFANTYEAETGKVYTPQLLSPEAYQTAIETTTGMYGAGMRGGGRGGSGMH